MLGPARAKPRIQRVRAKLKCEPLTARWLEGNAGLPADLAQYPPASPAFFDYATSWGAENLLSVSYQWWHDPNAIRVHYEQLVREPEKAFNNLAEELHQSAEKLPLALEANPLKVLRETPNRHGWQGTPGLWRRVVLPFDAWRILRRHGRVFRTLEYGVSPYVLTRRSAIRNWQALAT